MAAKGSHGLLLLAGDDLPQIAQNSQKLLLGIASHRFHRCNFRGCTCLRSALPLARARSAPTKQTVILPQISQNPQNLLLGRPPTDFTDLHRWLGCVDSSGGILASAAAKCLPQIAQIYTEVRLPSGGKTRKQYALKGQKHIAQGNALGKYAPH